MSNVFRLRHHEDHKQSSLTSNLSEDVVQQIALQSSRLRFGYGTNSTSRMACTTWALPQICRAALSIPGTQVSLMRDMQPFPIHIGAHLGENEVGPLAGGVAIGCRIHHILVSPQLGPILLRNSHLHVKDAGKTLE